MVNYILLAIALLLGYILLRVIIKGIQSACSKQNNKNMFNNEHNNKDVAPNENHTQH